MTNSRFENHLLSQFKIQYPIIQAPMAGGITTPEFLKSVFDAGALPSLATGYRSLTGLKEDLEALKTLGVSVYNANLFVPELLTKETVAKAKPAYQALKPFYGALNITQEPIEFREIQELDDYAKKIELLLEYRVPIVSFVFDMPSLEIIRQFKAIGTYTIGTATSVEEVVALDTLELDAIILQGIEAGGHRASFISGCGDGDDLRTLLKKAKQVTDRPLLVAGGICQYLDIDHYLTEGAAAAVIGTAFLACAESGASSLHKEKILNACAGETMLTNAFTGKWARGFTNRFMVQYAEDDLPVACYPVQHYFTSALRAEAKKNNFPEYMSLWAGMNAHRVTEKTVKALMARLVSP
ncbi:nitronate monooxygenase [Ignatzschineria sp. RMDPL8A]|uniref:NAD(P)H-dependent flavin oxidoreductase n=1 Tax=Ignatzschineria sp. RMDPL8A TaxID=2999236 RepID=UPI00244665BF|nr:nitronate monooxygenase [Ignatzschineria sp. RMDPL8A]MDG9730435.1 nitronate monooxygenase [Ignatzschineria sp. RMDPL8A]